MNFCPGHNFQSIEGSNFKLHPQIDHYGEVQCTRTVAVFHLLLSTNNGGVGGGAWVSTGITLSDRPFVHHKKLVWAITSKV